MTTHTASAATLTRFTRGQRILVAPGASYAGRRGRVIRVNPNGSAWVRLDETHRRVPLAHVHDAILFPGECSAEVCDE